LTANDFINTVVLGGLKMDTETARNIAIGCVVIQGIFMVFSWKFLDSKAEPSKWWHLTGIGISSIGLFASFVWFGDAYTQRDEAFPILIIHLIILFIYISEHNETKRKRRKADAIKALQGGKK
jgi:hypothetical protein